MSTVNATPIIAAKITVPKVPDFALWRARLSISAISSSRTRMIQIIAPAGYGKTILASQWVERLARSTTALWYSIDDRDNKDSRLLEHLAKACSDAKMTPHILPSIDHLLELLDQRPNEIVLVFDNCDVIAEQGEINVQLSYLIRHCPSNVKIVLLSRTALALGLMRWQLIDALVTLTASDLAFTTNEISDLLLTQHANVTLMLAQTIKDETGGWPTAIKLLLNVGTIRVGLDKRSALGKDFQAAMLAYYRGEVLTQLSPEQWLFVHSTVLLDSFTARLSEQITPLTLASCSSLIEWLLSVQLIEEIDHAEKSKQEPWYRYRPFICEALRLEANSKRELKAEVVLQKATLWLDEGGYTYQSALCAARVGDFAHIAKLIERDWREIMMGDNVYLIYRWACLLPKNVLQQNPWLCCIVALAAFLSDDAAFSAFCEKRATEHYLKDDSKSDAHYVEAMALIANIFSLHGRYAETRELADIALAHLPHADFYLRYSAAQAREYAQPTIDWLSYRNMLLQCHPQIVASGNDLFTANSFAFLADSESNLGNIKRALEYVQSSIESTDKYLHPRRPTFMAIHRSHMNAAYYRGQMGEAEFYRKQFEAVVKASYALPSLSLALVYRALFDFLQGNVEQIAETLSEAGRASTYGLFGVALPLSFVSYIMDHKCLDLEYLLEQQDATFKASRDYLRLSFVVKAAKGDLSLLETLQAWVLALEDVRTLERVQSNILLAEYAQKAGLDELSVEALLTALAAATAEHIAQPFLSERQLLLPIMERCKEALLQDSFAQTIYLRLSQPDSGETSASGSDERLELTMRESEIVYLLAAGMGAQDIAERLGISKETVRKHIVNSYRKLGVHSRAQLLLKIR